MKALWKIGSVTLMATLIGNSVFAADEATLVRLLTRADIAHNFGAYCAQFTPSIMEETKGNYGNVRELMQHVTREVISDLPADMAKQIVLRSASAARTGILLAIRPLYRSDSSEARERLTEWCEQKAKPSLKQFVSDHDERHDAFEAVIQRAKQDSLGALRK